MTDTELIYKAAERSNERMKAVMGVASEHDEPLESDMEVDAFLARVFYGDLDIEAIKRLQNVVNEMLDEGDGPYSPLIVFAVGVRLGMYIGQELEKRDA